MDFENMRARVERSIVRVLDHDAFLFEVNANEESVSHKLAEYLQQEFPRWHVDREYNRYEDQIKRLIDYDTDRVFPDIIIHRRGTEENLFVIEVKMDANLSEEDTEDEKQKVRLYCEEIGYCYGLFLNFGQGNPEGMYLGEAPAHELDI